MGVISYFVANVYQAQNVYKIYSFRANLSILIYILSVDVRRMNYNH